MDFVFCSFNLIYLFLTILNLIIFNEIVWPSFYFLRNIFPFLIVFLYSSCCALIFSRSSGCCWLVLLFKAFLKNFLQFLVCFVFLLHYFINYTYIIFSFFFSYLSIVSFHCCHASTILKNLIHSYCWIAGHGSFLASRFLSFFKILIPLDVRWLWGAKGGIRIYSHPLETLMFFCFDNETNENNSHRVWNSHSYQYPDLD